MQTTCSSLSCSGLRIAGSNQFTKKNYCKRNISIFTYNLLCKFFKSAFHYFRPSTSPRLYLLVIKRLLHLTCWRKQEEGHKKYFSIKSCHRAKRILLDRIFSNFSDKTIRKFFSWNMTNVLFNWKSTFKNNVFITLLYEIVFRNICRKVRWSLKILLMQQIATTKHYLLFPINCSKNANWK